MDTITIPKEKYEIMRRRISLYERIFKKFDQDFGVEIYTPERIEEFGREDELGEPTRSRVKQTFGS